MRTLFISQHLWELVDKDDKEDRGYQRQPKERWKSIIFSSNKRFQKLLNSEEAWDALQIGYQGTTKVLVVKLQTLRGKLKCQS